MFGKKKPLRSRELELFDRLTSTTVTAPVEVRSVQEFAGLLRQIAYTVDALETLADINQQLNYCYVTARTINEEKYAHLMQQLNTAVNEILTGLSALENGDNNE